MENSLLSQLIEIEERYKDDRTIGDMLEGYRDDYFDEDDDEDDKITFTYRLIGIKIDGSDDTIDIEASCEEEAEIIIESFHDGSYILESRNDEYSFLGEFGHQLL